jgi:tRNA(Ile)-lysidine synthase
LKPISAAEFATAMAALGPFEETPRLAAAISGGADSMALAVLANAWVRARGGHLLALIVDHGLRAESRAEAILTQERLAALGIASRILSLSALSNGAATAAQAREARYQALIAACRTMGFLHLLLGHHAADQAETIWMRKQAQSGVMGLAGMAALRELPFVRLLRPLLRFPPERLRATLETAGVAWVEDPSNRNRRFLRARLRAQLAAAKAKTLGPLLLTQAKEAGSARKTAEHGSAEALARSVRLFPEGYALLTSWPLPPNALASLIQALAGAAYPPPLRQVAPLAASPRSATLAGIRVLPAGKLGHGWLLVREAAAMGPAVPAAPDQCWDGRFRLAFTAQPPNGAMLGPLGAASAARLRDISHLPAAVMQTLPAIWCKSVLVAVPHLGYPNSAACRAMPVVLCPPVPAAGGSFLSATEWGCRAALDTLS